MTGFSHAKLLFNRELRTLLPELPLRNADNQGDHHRQARLQDNQMKKKMADYANSKCTRKPSTLKVGDVVLLQNNSRLKNKMEPSYFPQQLIVTKKKSSAVTATGQGKNVNRNSSFFRQFICGDPVTPDGD